MGLGLDRTQALQALILAVMALFLSGRFVSARYRRAWRGST